MLVKKRFLAELAHVINYAIGYHEYNLGVSRIQTHFFEKAGKNVGDYIDQVEPYDGAQHEAAIMALLGVTEISKVYVILKDKPQTDEEIDVDAAWLANIINDAITRYNEKHCFSMMGIEHHDDVRQALGKEEGDKLIEELGDFFMSSFICGNAEHSVTTLKEWLAEQGTPYTPPPAPYLEKYNEKMEPVRQAVRELL